MSGADRPDYRPAYERTRELLIEETKRTSALTAEVTRLRSALMEIKTMLNSDYPEWRIAERALNG